MAERNGVEVLIVRSDPFPLVESCFSGSGALVGELGSQFPKTTSIFLGRAPPFTAEFRGTSVAAFL
jgi:hypothetical protein